MRVYISGPVTGMPGYNRPAFIRAANLLRSWGHDPINPLNIADRIGYDLPHSEYMREDLRELLSSESLYLLRGFWHSRGAMVEIIVALAIGIPIVRQRKHH